MNKQNTLHRIFDEQTVRRPRLISIAPEHYEDFRSCVQRSKRADPFSRSVAYYLMTGRKGLWLYGDEKTAMIIARHPNRDDKLLLFPPTGEQPDRLLVESLRDDRLPSGDIELARIGPGDLQLAGRLAHKVGRSFKRETVLDWAYPVHVVSPETILEGARPGSGKAFNSFRGHLNRAARDGYRSEAVDVGKHEQALVSIIADWAQGKVSNSFQYHDLVTPTLSVIDLMKRGKEINIGGTITFDRDGQPMGFWLWECFGNQAASLVRANLRGWRGNGEFAILKMAEQLKEAGISEMCLGGSEIGSLNSFKEKMQPIRSIEMLTLPLPRLGSNLQLTSKMTRNDRRPALRA